jgi:hypothetical protein
MFNLALGKKVLIALQLLVSNRNLESKGVGKESIECFEVLELHVENNPRNLMKNLMFKKNPKRFCENFHVLKNMWAYCFRWAN